MIRKEKKRLSISHGIAQSLFGEELKSLTRSFEKRQCFQLCSTLFVFLVCLTCTPLVEQHGTDVVGSNAETTKRIHWSRQTLLVELRKTIKKASKKEKKKTNLFHDSARWFGPFAKKLHPNERRPNLQLGQRMYAVCQRLNFFFWKPRTDFFRFITWEEHVGTTSRKHATHSVKNCNPISWKLV